jgi:DNA repair ATPase RecN
MADLNAQEAELSGFVDRGTQIVLREAIKQVVETFSQTETLEDILNYLEELRTASQNEEERIKDIQQKTKQAHEKVNALETSIRNLLQRMQTIEVQMNTINENFSHFEQLEEKLEKLNQLDALEQLEKLDRLDMIESKLDLLVSFFAQAPMSRMFAKIKLENQEYQE